MKSSVENLKDRPNDEKKAVAGGIAIGVIILLIIVWAFFFFRKLAQGTPLNSAPSNAAKNVFDFSGLDAATQQFQEGYSKASDQLNQLREQAADAQIQAGVQSENASANGDMQADGSAGTPQDAFGGAPPQP